MKKILLLTLLILSTFLSFGQVCTAPAISSQPASVVRCSASGDAILSVTATGTSLTYQWEISTNGGSTWSQIATATNSTYTLINPTSSLNANLYRVVITGSCGTVTSNASIIYVSPALTHSAVSASPASTCSPGATSITGTVSGGTTANAVIGSTGIININIPDGVPAGLNSTIVLPALTIQQASNLKLRLNFRHSWAGDVKVRLTSPCGTTFVFDRPGVPPLYGNANNFGTNNSATPPPAVYIFDLAGATIIPDAPNGTGIIAAGTYQPSNDASPGVSHNWAGLTFPCSTAGNWTLNISDNEGSDVGMLAEWAILTAGNYRHTLTGPGTIVQNASGGANNSTGNFSVNALPAGSHTFVLTSTDALGCTVSSNVAVTVNNVPSITTQPVNRIICAGQNTTFAVVDNTPFPPSYQWQINQGAGFVNIVNGAPFSGATTSTLTITGAATTLNGNTFRVNINNTCGNVTSSIVTLTVNALTAVTATPLTAKICLSDTLVALSGTPAGGSWSGVGVSGNNFVPSATAVGTYTLTYSYTNAAGCLSTATTIAKVEDCPERIRLLRDDAVILWPNPNNGRFNIRINSTLYNYLGMRVYTAAGQLVRIQNFGGLVYNRVIPIDMTNLPGGVYMVKFYYDDGVRTSDKTFKVVVGR